MGFLSRILKKYFPTLWVKRVNIPKAKKRWKNSIEELVLIKGKKLTSRQGCQSVIFFSCHKSGSSIGLKYLKKLARENELKHINYDAYVSSVSPASKPLFHEISFQKRAYLTQGYFFGCYRFFRPIPELEKYKVILLLRDPRDVLVSYYYSMKYNNTIHQLKGLELRKRLQHISIDDYVLEILPRFKSVFENYITELYGKDYVYFSKFEDLLNDSENWLTEASEHCGLSCSEELLERISTGITSNLKTEKKYQHHRKAKPGEFKEKLKETTIEKINAEFEIILKTLNYTV